MLDALKKAVGMQSKEDMGQVAPVEESMKNITSEVFGSEALLAQLAEANEMLATNQGTITTLTNEIEGYKEQLANLQQYAQESEAKAVAAAEEMKAKELADKREQLANVIGKDNPGFDTTFAALESLNAEAFGVILNGFKASFALEAESAFFKEVGVSGDCDLSNLKEEESETARIIKQNYQNQ